MFEVDKRGLRQLLERRGKQFALFEILQNAWDQNVSRVDITFTKDAGDRRVFLKVVDDDPEGFADIRHAYTLFAPSNKKSNPKQRGRFNLGEKLVIALCEVSRICTTTGAFEFSGNERKSLPRSQRTKRGSVFEGEMLMTRDEFEECCESIHKVLPPEGIDTYFNGEILGRRDPLMIIENHSLPTEIADDEGYLRPTRRQTDIHVYQAGPGEPGMLYEMGIPVVETDDDFHVDVQQKVPLSIDRENVTPAYLRAIRTTVVNAVHRHLNPETANHPWVAEALADPNITDDAVHAVIVQRFGEKAVAFDPSDLEANSRAVAAGYNVVHGRSMSRDMWSNVRRAGELVPAGRVMPTHQPQGDQAYKELVPTAPELKVIEAIHKIAVALIGFPINIRIVSTAQMTALASYGGRTMTFNRFRLGKAFLTKLDPAVVDLVIHELGHEIESNHLDDRYNNALTRLGAKLAFLVRDDPTLLEAR